MSESFTGLTDEQAQAFHKLFVVSFIVFTAIAIVAHFLVWQWRPWFPPEGGYASLIDGARMAAEPLIQYLS
jgi:light-harvesting complex 1 beta chain